MYLQIFFIKPKRDQVKEAPLHYAQSVWETKLLEHSSENRCPLYILYKISLAQANFLLGQLKMHSIWPADEC